MSGSDITITTSDGESYSGYLATPESGSGPGVIVIQEVFGVNKNIRQIADDYAAKGYFALAPDIFWRQEPGVQLTHETKEGWDRAIELMTGMDVDKAISDLQDATTHLRNIEGCNGKVGCTGFCLGGRLTYLMACRTDVDAASGYYGVQIEKMLGEAVNISKPVILHIACLDKFVPAEAQKALHDGLDGHTNVTLYDYADADHAFARYGGDEYDKAAADLASQRTLELFKANLSA